jgi:hypothetical protein
MTKILFFPRHLYILKWGLLFDEIRGRPHFKPSEEIILLLCNPKN